MKLETIEPCYSLVIPIYNEADVLPLLFERLASLLEKLDQSAEIVLVNDGSRDSSLALMRLKARQDPRYRIVNLSRNFGHQIAITAGMDNAGGCAVIIMDADLQDPPELVLEMIGKWKEGFSVVSARRIAREGEGRFKRWSAHIFYRVLRTMTSVDIDADVGDFRLLDRKVVNALMGMREQDRFVRGMISWLGFNQTCVDFVRAERAAGSTKYPFLKMLKLAVNGILGFSDIPLRMALWGGALVSLLAISYGLFVVGGWFFNDTLVAGWTSTIVVLSFLGGINLVMTGVVGLYVGRIHNEVKRRPLYLVDAAREDGTRVGGVLRKPVERRRRVLGAESEVIE
ncbi:glycosyltransferase family 2 protein [Sphingosinicella microcystinivorans]|uniref:glycosyltransferase family 2 protein n=1 Tax=Sphingosinicella microcystinivorans TaxID=335406 RepID=UPI0022F39958|nr:glycosyltransferase family 2 protein [Sphingosinicella microcystinivorans]WBX83204.1 glycosyltransferase family 2 protein [Sphingosinicella microcystinivorans]